MAGEIQGRNSDRERGVELFIADKRSKIGLSKCENFNRSLHAATAGDGSVAEFFEAYARTQSGGKASKTWDGDELAAYVRGVKTGLKIVVQHFREAVLLALGPGTLARFDELSREIPLCSGQDGDSLWDVFFAEVDQRLARVLDPWARERCAAGLFKDALRAIEKSPSGGASGANVSTARLASIPFATQRTYALADVMALVNPDHRAQAGEQAPKPLPTVADYVEKHEEMVSRFLGNNVSQEHVRGFIALASAMDHGSRGPALADVAAGAKALRRYLDKGTDKGGKRKSSLPTDERKRMEEELKGMHEQVVWFTRGALQALRAVTLGDAQRALRARLNAAREFHDLVQQGECDPGPLADFLRLVVVRRFEAGLKSGIASLGNGLRNEGLARDFGDDNVTVRMKGQALVVKVSATLARNLKFVKIVLALAKLNPKLFPSLALNPSAAHPLAVNYGRLLSANPKCAAGLVRHPSFAALLGKVIEADFAYKNMMVDSPAFFLFLFKHRKQPDLLPFLQSLARAKTSVKKAVYANVALLASLFALDLETGGDVVSRGVLGDAGLVHALSAKAKDPTALRAALLAKLPSAASAA